MMSNVVFDIKTFSNLLDDSKGFIGKPVPLTPTLLGWAILNQHFSRDHGSKTTNAKFLEKRLCSRPCFYGSREWANVVLKLAIRELKNEKRVLSARQLEIYYILGELKKYGFRWQVARLRNHINLAIKQGRFTARRADPLKGGGGLS